MDSARTRERLGEWERESDVYESKQEWERERGIKWVSERERRDFRERTRERERESVCVCVCVHACMHIIICTYTIVFTFCTISHFFVLFVNVFTAEESCLINSRLLIINFLCVLRCIFDFWGLIWENVTYNIDSLVKGLLIMLNYWECHLWYLQPCERSIVDASYFHSQTA